MQPPFERIALLLQGGGALGSYQGGVYQALAEAKLFPNCIGGVSIGAINAALIAGNAPEHGVEALKKFWEKVTGPPFGIPVVPAMESFLEFGGDVLHGLINQAHSLMTVTGGAPGFFTPRTIFSPGTLLSPNSFYDTSPLKTTLEELVDFDRINQGPMDFGVAAVNVRTGNLEYFDTAKHTIRPEHIMASGALPPGFPAVEIDGEYYWDGGLVSNTPLQWVVDGARKDTLAFQVDLWSASGEMPSGLIGIDLRQKDIRFSSRTRSHTDQFRRVQRSRRAVLKLLSAVSDKKILSDPDVVELASGADDKVYSIVHLIYRAKRYEGSSKDYEFSRSTMELHWSAGYQDAKRALRQPNLLERPGSSDGVSIFDFQ